MPWLVDSIICRMQLHNDSGQVVHTHAPQHPSLQRYMEFLNQVPLTLPFKPINH